MRIAYICADRGIPLAGNKGAAIHVRAVAQALADRHHDVTVVAMRVDGRLPRTYRPQTLEVPFDRTLKELRSSIDGDGRSVLSGELRNLLLNSAVHESLLAVEQDGSVDAIYERYSLWSIAGLRFARCRSMPFVLEVNAPLVHEQQKYRQLRLSDAAEGIERFLFSQADAIFVPSEELRSYILDRVGKRRRLYVTPNGVDVDRFVRPLPVRNTDGELSRRPFTVVFVGSLKPWHGVGILLDAFERLKRHLPDARLLVIGDGPERPQVEKLRSRLGEQSVVMTGEVAHEEIPGLLAAADVGVAPYPQLEEFYFSPLKVIEYLAAGLPVVASSIGQLRRLVQDGETGLLVPAGERQPLAAALLALATDPGLRQRLGRKARRRALEKHDWARIAQRIEAVLSDLIVKANRKQARSAASKKKLASVGGSR